MKENLDIIFNNGDYTKLPIYLNRGKNTSHAKHVKDDNFYTPRQCKEVEDLHDNIKLDHDYKFIKKHFHYRWINIFQCTKCLQKIFIDGHDLYELLSDDFDKSYHLGIFGHGSEKSKKWPEYNGHLSCNNFTISNIVK